MPYRRKSSTRKRPTRRPTRRPARARRTYRKQRYAIAGSGKMPLFPRTMYTKFSYAEDFNLTNSTGGIPSTYVFRANSLFDPNLTGVGGQPRYYDTLCGANNTAAPYKNYLVQAAKITLTIFSRSDSVANNPSYNGFISIRALQQNAPPLTREEMMEGTFMKRIPITNAQSGMPRRLSFYLPMKKIYGCKDVSDDLQRYGAEYNGNPIQECYFIVSMCPIGGATGASFDIMAKINFYTKLFSANDVASS